MKKKVVFFINSIQQQRCLKRIEEFIANGYEIEAYGFNRAKEIPTLPTSFSVNIIANLENHKSYMKRIMVMYNAMKPIIDQNRNEDVIYYYFLLDVAMVGCHLSKKPYIYEESDLMQTYLPSKILRNILNGIDRYIIQHSLITTMTSEGFAQYHFDTQWPDNIVIVPNRLNRNVLELPFKTSSIDINHIRFAFVGGARFNSILNFVKIIASHFPQHEFHFYGTILDLHQEFMQIINLHENVFMHGKFSNPKDLPDIYEHIDIVLAAYDTNFENVRYAEPNKLYEAAFFKTPIIVSKGTYLASKVTQWGIGFELNAMNNEEIITFIKRITLDGIQECIDNCNALDTRELINENPLLFKKLSSITR